MLIKRINQSNGFLFEVQYKGKSIALPLQNLKKEVLRDPDWPQLNALEQIYFQGFLQQTTVGYFLNCEDFYELEAELIGSLPIPQKVASISIEENGNVGGHKYSISWYLLIHGKHAGKSIRRGCVAVAGGYEFLLTREQYRLINELESWNDERNSEKRARFQAKSKYLAQKAGAVLSNFTLQREFLFADRADMNLVLRDSQHLVLKPTLEGIPEEYQTEIPAQLPDIIQSKQGNKRIKVFTSKDVQRQYNEISRMPDIVDADIPRFISNPLAFLPETIEFDAEQFSKRVRGLKIKTARAIPYIREKEDSEDKWFPVQIGCSVSSESEDGHEIEETPELHELMQQAAQNGEEYIYYQDTWIKLDPQAYKQIQQANAIIQQELQKGTHPDKIIPKILDIYDNIDGVQYDEEFQKLLAERYKPTVDLAYSFNGKLKDYQLLGYQFLKNHYETKTGILLADDMGLGKTVQIISLLAYMLDKHALAPSLLVMPMSLIDNWQSEIHKFLPSVCQIYVHQGSKRYRTSNMIRNNQIVITTYETLARDQALLGTIRWACVICDEAQKVKNFNTLAAGAVKGMNTPCRIALTGTPVENRLAELWSIVDFVQPGLLGSYKAFRHNYEIPIEKHTGGHTQLAERLVQKIEPIFLRRTKEDVLAGNLPPKYEETIEIGISKPQDALYKKLVQEMRDSDENMALATIQKLLMVCSHPRLVTKQAIQNASASELLKESPKLAWTVQLLKEIKKKREKVIIFTKYIAMQAILRQVIYEEFGIDSPIINGDVKGNRLKLIETFGGTPGFAVMILSPRAAGVGLNITAANHVVHYTREWNPAIENQATDRAYRIGQSKPVSVYYPVMESEEYISVEERLDELLSEKRHLMKSVILPTNLEIKAEQFYDLFT